MIGYGSKLTAWTSMTRNWWDRWRANARTGRAPPNFRVANHPGVIASWFESKCRVRPLLEGAWPRPQKPLVLRAMLSNRLSKPGRDWDDPSLVRFWNGFTRSLRVNDETRSQPRLRERPVRSKG